MESWVSISEVSFYSSAFCEAREIMSSPDLFCLSFVLSVSYTKIRFLDFLACEPQFPGFGVSIVGSLGNYVNYTLPNGF